MKFNFAFTADTTDEALRKAVEELDVFVTSHPTFERQKAAVLATVEAAIYGADDPRTEERVNVTVAGEVTGGGKSRGSGLSIDVVVKILT